MAEALARIVLDYNVTAQKMGLCNGNPDKPKVVYVGSVYNCMNGKVIYRATSSMIEQKVIDECEEFIARNE